jgi:hypothetical protein
MSVLSYSPNIISPRHLASNCIILPRSPSTQIPLGREIEQLTYSSAPYTTPDTRILYTGSRRLFSEPLCCRTRRTNTALASSCRRSFALARRCWFVGFLNCLRSLRSRRHYRRRGQGVGRFRVTWLWFVLWFGDVGEVVVGLEGFG